MATNVSALADDLEVHRGDTEVQKPVVIDLYNSSMGGVDRTDQLREYYSVGRSCYKWYRYIFWFLMYLYVMLLFFVITIG